MAEKDIKKIISSFHPLERKVFPFLAKFSSVKDLMTAANLKEVEVTRALQWMQNRKILTLKENLNEVIDIDSNGKKYLSEGLPEARLLNSLKSSDLTLEQARKKSSLTKEELNIAIGVLRKKAAVFITKEKELVLKILDQGRRLLEKDSLEEKFLKKQFPVPISSLSDEERYAYLSLKSRKNIIKTNLIKIKTPELTELGHELINSGFELADMNDRLTPAMLRDGSWNKRNFRRYDVTINVPKIHGGRKQHYRRFLDEVRQRFLALGFSEMFGPMVESEFWDMDALFMPQFHSARDIHQAYYIREPKYSKLDPALVEAVKKAHENGFNTGSLGWRYKFDTKQTQRNLLRTQTTAASAHMLASKNLKIPGKYFAIARCFRYDVIDATHNVDFFQTEGIVVEEGLDFRHLKSLLKMFAEEFCETDQFKIKPAYFPFTEPSAELFAKHPELGWIELGGSGIFRPEMTKPLGIDVPVLAWGLGIDRIGMFRLGIDDIRKLFSHDLKFLRSVKVI